MQRSIGIFMLFVAAVGFGAAVRSGVSAQVPQVQQARQGQGQDALPALLEEVRGLRAAMEQMASAGPRVQLALGRLQLQEQRVNNLLRRIETVRGSLAGAQQEEDKMRNEVVTLEDALKSPEAGVREQGEAMLRTVKSAHGRALAEVQRLQADESSVTQELAMEQARWTDINQRMEELERAFTRK